MSLTLSGDSPKISADSTGVITSGTAVASTSGTSIDFTNIPSWVKRITVMFSGVSVSGTSSIIIQLGDSGGVENTGYLASASIIGASTVLSSSHTTGFGIRNVTAATVVSGAYTITNHNGDTWLLFGVGSDNAVPATFPSAGSKALSATLDRIRITTVNGTDTFDAGSINILYE
jgi:uncharacterized protein YaiE (UPF0345 family)